MHEKAARRVTALSILRDATTDLSLHYLVSFHSQESVNHNELVVYSCPCDTKEAWHSGVCIGAYRVEKEGGGNQAVTVAGPTELVIGDPLSGPLLGCSECLRCHLRPAA